MKNKIDNKLLVVAVVSAISLNGCVSKTLEITDIKKEGTNVNAYEKARVSKWKSMPTRKKEECKDCYTSLIKAPKNIEETIVSGNHATIEEYKNPYKRNRKEVQNQPEDNNYLVDETYVEDDYYPISNSENKRFASKNSIQVGAFRKYAGAKVYAKRYSLLTNQYNVDIKENVKDNQPIYRVQIEGFSSPEEAEDFMQRYGLDGAFLVRR